MRPLPARPPWKWLGNADNLGPARLGAQKNAKPATKPNVQGSQASFEGFSGFSGFLEAPGPCGGVRERPGKRPKGVLGGVRGRPGASRGRPGASQGGVRVPGASGVSRGVPGRHGASRGRPRTPVPGAPGTPPGHLSQHAPGRPQDAPGHLFSAISVPRLRSRNPRPLGFFKDCCTF